MFQSIVSDLRLIASPFVRAAWLVAEHAPVYARIVYAKFTSPKAIALYRFVWDCCLLLFWGAIWSGERFREWCDALVDASLAPEISAPAAQPAPVEPDPWEAPVAVEQRVELPAATPVPVLRLLPPAPAVEAETAPAPQPAKRRGRPKGSKNRRKSA